jgi:isopropylmalate/homocitrate/citramalate synthase
VLYRDGLVFSTNEKNCLGRLRLFFCESGIHCGALLKDFSTYQSFSPETVECKCARLVAGRYSGTNVIRHLMEHAGVVPDAEETQRLFTVVQDESLRKKRPSPHLNSPACTAAPFLTVIAFKNTFSPNKKR